MKQPLLPPAARPALRRGVSILEVLFAILVTTIGLLGAVALFPVASAQARKARINDAMAVAGRSAVHTFDSLGMRRPERWVAWNENWDLNNMGQQIPPLQFKAVDKVSYRYDRSYCIDPRFVAANYAPISLRARANTFPADAANTSVNPSPTLAMMRVSLVNGQRTGSTLVADPPMGWIQLGGTGPWRTYQDNAIFQLDDDLAFLRPGIDDVSAAGGRNDRSLPALQAYDELPTVSGSYAKRQTQGHYSWMATLVPKLDLYAGMATDEYVLSIVMFHDRPGDLSLGPTNPNALLLERNLNVYFDGGDGSTGGEVIIYAPFAGTPNQASDEAAAQTLKLRANDWVLLAGNTGGSSPAHFQWFRVSSCDDEPTYEQAFSSGSVNLPARYQVYATLVGRDWNINLRNPRTTFAGTAQATIVEGVVGVYEKTVRLDTSSGF